MVKYLSENKKLWECLMYSETGERHKKRDMLSQDRCIYFHEGSRQCIALLDGIGKTDLNVIGCERIGQWIAKFLVEQFEAITVKKDTSVIQKMLQEIRKQMMDLTGKYQTDQTEFASTIMAVCIDQKSDSYCVLHLGDGIILYKDTSEKVQVYSYPKNGLAYNQTYLTISENAATQIKLFRGDLEKITEFALLSDGMYEHPIEISDLEQRVLVTEKNQKWFSEDDKSMVILRR